MISYICGVGWRVVITCENYSGQKNTNKIKFKPLRGESVSSMSKKAVFPEPNVLSGRERGELRSGH